MRAPWPKFSVVTVDLAEEIHEGDEIAPGRRMIDEIVATRPEPHFRSFPRSMPSSRCGAIPAAGFSAWRTK